MSVVAGAGSTGIQNDLKTGTHGNDVARGAIDEPDLWDATWDSIDEELDAIGDEGLAKITARARELFPAEFSRRGAPRPVAVPRLRPRRCAGRQAPRRAATATLARAPAGPEPPGGGAEPPGPRRAPLARARGRA
jgi:hypothetical protein